MKSIGLNTTTGKIRWQEVEKIIIILNKLNKANLFFMDLQLFNTSFKRIFSKNVTRLI